ncbi:MAG: hypothetical protein AAFX99_27810 [Myxococcota bacterium]
MSHDRLGTAVGARTTVWWCSPNNVVEALGLAARRVGVGIWEREAGQTTDNSEE